MAEKTFSLSIDPEFRAAFAVYAVAVGERLGLEPEKLMTLRSASESSDLSGVREVDEILEFLSGLYAHNNLGHFPIPTGFQESATNGDRMVEAYCAVAPLIQARV